MIFNEKETKESYDFPVTNEYFRYLKKRKIVSEAYVSSLQNCMVGILRENILFIENYPFCVNCILGKSRESIFDIIGTNKLYNLSPKYGTAFAVLHGDDYLFFKPNDLNVYYKSISTNEEFLVADSYSEFLTKIALQTPFVPNKEIQ